MTLYYPPQVMGVSNTGNTGGNTGTSFGTFVLAGSNNVSLSQSTNTNGQHTIWFEGGAGGGGAVSLGISTAGNTSGTSGFVQSRMAFAGINLTVSQSVNAQSATLTISALPLPNFQYGIGMNSSTDGGNTSGVAGQATGSVTIDYWFYAGSNISLRQSLSSDSGSLTIFGPTANTFKSTNIGNERGWAIGSVSLGQNTVWIWPHNLQQAVSGSAFQVPVFITNSSTALSSQGKGYTAHFGVYTRHSTNSTVLTQHYSTSYTASFSASSNVSWNIGIITGLGNSTSYNSVSASSAGLNLSASVHGSRELLIPCVSTFTAGEYWFAWRHSSSSNGTTNNLFNISHYIASSVTMNRLGVSANNSNNGLALYMGLGSYSATSSALPSVISMSEVRQTAINPIMYYMGESK